jgi:hypothetical protein
VPVISAGEKCRALPESAVVTFVNAELAAEEFVVRRQLNDKIG